MMRIGITGGIGAGKTTVCHIFESLGIPVYYADDRAKDIMTRDKEVVDKVKSLLGPDVYHNEGGLNKQRIAEMIFKNPDMRQQLNAIVHPAVGRDVRRWFDHLEQVGGTPYALEEAALLIESGTWKSLHAVIVVICPLELRIERVMQRDHLPLAAVVERLASQMSDEERIVHADYLIHNDGHTSLVQQVFNIHAQIVQSQHRSENT